MKYGGSGYNTCPIVTVFIYIFEQNQSQEEGFCVCVCMQAKEMFYKALEVDSHKLSYWPPFGERYSLQNRLNILKGLTS